MVFCDLVKSSFFKGGGFLWILLWVVGGCTPRVRLPDPAPFPKQPVRSPALVRYQKALDRAYAFRQTALWRHLERCWGTRELWGRLYYKLTLQPGKPAQCELRRTALTFRRSQPTPVWRKLFALQRDGLMTTQATYKFSLRVAKERRALKKSCQAACPISLPVFQGSQPAEMPWVVSRAEADLPSDQKEPPPTRRLPPPSQPAKAPVQPARRATPK